jgi:predicted DNA-binding transcriptional regulator YafY
MYHPTTRVLAVLELLQTHGRMTGAELATRLEVDIRTARRYITMLQDLGVPVVAERGRNGAYTLGSGYKLPPMMFTNDEALALTIGLLAARKLGLADAAPAVESAIAKVERVMPKTLRGQVRALSETIALDMQQPRAVPAGEVMLSLSTAAQAERRVHMHYRADKGEETERDFDPYGLGFRGGRWYAVGHCHLRRGLRSWRCLRPPLRAHRTSMRSRRSPTPLPRCRANTRCACCWRRRCKWRKPKCPLARSSCNRCRAA